MFAHSSVLTVDPQFQLKLSYQTSLQSSPASCPSSLSKNILQAIGSPLHRALQLQCLNIAPFLSRYACDNDRGSLCTISGTQWLHEVRRLRLHQACMATVLAQCAPRRALRPPLVPLLPPHQMRSWSLHGELALLNLHAVRGHGIKLHTRQERPWAVRFRPPF